MTTDQDNLYKKLYAEIEKRDETIAFLQQVIDNLTNMHQKQYERAEEERRKRKKADVHLRNQAAIAAEYSADSSYFCDKTEKLEKQVEDLKAQRDEIQRTCEILEQSNPLAGDILKTIDADSPIKWTALKVKIANLESSLECERLARIGAQHAQVHAEKKLKEIVNESQKNSEAT